MTSRSRTIWRLGMATGLFGISVLAEEPVGQPMPPPAAPGPAKVEEPPQPPSPSATVEKIMQQAVRNISARYNLNEEQRKKTDELMKREVTRFLTEHEKEVWPVIRDILATQMIGKPPSNVDDVTRIGRATKPLARLAEKAIFDANAEWRAYLTPDQKRMHDFDMEEMKKQFDHIHRHLDDWSAGKPTDDPLIPPAETVDRSPPRPPKPPDDLPAAMVSVPNVSIFDTIVEEFIKEHNLDQGQIDSARSILEEAKAKANDYSNAKKQELGEVAAKQSAAMEKRDLPGVAEAEAAQRKLLEPFHELVRQMQSRLQSILTTAQREAYDRKVAAKSKAPARKAALKPQPPKPTEGAAPVKPEPTPPVGPQPAPSDDQPPAPQPKPKSNDE